LAAAASPASAANPWLGGPVLNIAHQGGEDQFPSNTLYAFKQATRAGADMLELDIGVTKDGKVVVLHDTTVDRVTNGKGTVISKTLKQIRALDGAYWFSKKSANHYDHAAKDHPFRGIATGKKKPPKGFKRTDFRIATLSEVMAAFPKTPINIEIKGRTKAETDDEYIANADVLAALLKSTPRRDLIVVSFKQKAVDRFHELVPAISVSPGVEGLAAWAFSNQSPGDGVQTFDPPMTYQFGATKIDTTTYIQKAHDEGYAWHSWFSGDDVDGPSGWTTLVDLCADGIMTSHPTALEAFLKTHPRPASCS
ncbi:MAG: glycerophosphodiester phosphodiesterase, partial [Solirubrobacterales bacterium]|nr:glycerophosphodiester phosphodiesterase [Solirubrobacterales bacterium]